MYECGHLTSKHHAGEPADALQGRRAIYIQRDK